MVTFKKVEFLPYLQIQIGTDSNNNPIVKNYYPEDNHKPLWVPGVSPNHKPSAGAFTENVTPMKGREFSVMELGWNYKEYNSLTFRHPYRHYLICTLEDEYNNDITVYGVIDRIEPIASKGPYTSTRVYWHVDYWLTYNRMMYEKSTLYGYDYRNLIFGSGRVKRGPASLARPEPSEPRLWLEDSRAIITSPVQNDNNKNWIIVYYTANWNITDNNNQIIATYTTFKIAFWQPGVNVTVNGVSYPSISDNYVYFGMTEEMLGLDPDSIIGVYVSPIPPADPSSGTVSSNSHTSTLGGVHAWYEVRAGYPQSFSKSVTLNGTDDNKKVLITDANGAIVGTVPWGIKYDGYMVTLDIGPSGAYLILRLTLTGNNNLNETEGRLFSIPLITAPVTSNAWASYNYSGEREFDKESKNLQREQAAISGIANLGSSAIGGAVAGSMTAPGPGTVIGAAGGLASGLTGTAVNYLLQGANDIKSQALIDRLKSNQTSSVIVTSGGTAWMTNVTPGQWSLVTMKRDTASAAELAAEQSELGYITDSFVSDCTSLINAGGPLRIEGLQVKGMISPEACAAISAMFERGVHLDLIQ